MTSFLKKIYPNLQDSSDAAIGDKVCVGVDLGTTYSLMAIINSADVDFANSNALPVQFVRIPQHSPDEIHPMIEDEKVASIVAFKDGKPYVGNNLYKYKGHPDYQYKRDIFYNWKIEMGVDHHPMYPNAITDKIDMPYKVAGGILNYMRKNYDSSNNLLFNTIITVPASFQANQRNDVLKAAEMAKIATTENMLVDEPNAAFLGYFNKLTDEEKQQWANEVSNENVLVVDFGGGTLDLSILNIDFQEESGITISNLAISRYNDLGGQDLDMLIAEEYLVPMFEKICPDFDSFDITDIQNTILPQLSAIGEDLKIGICSHLNMKAGSKDVKDLDIDEISFTREHSEVLFDDETFDLGNVSITGAKFKELFLKFYRGKSYSFKLVDKTITTVSESISDIINKADLTLDGVDFVLYVGGSSMNPFLPSLTNEKLINSEPLTSHQPDKLVAEGAAIYAYFLNAHGIELVKPITSETIGVRLKGNKFKPIIEKGQALPQAVELPEFKLQNSDQTDLVVPVCINGADFPIGEIRSKVSKDVHPDSTIKIEALITADKVFSMKVLAEDEVIGQAEFENPYANGILTEEQLDVLQTQAEMNQAKVEGNKQLERKTLKSLIWKHSDANNNLGTLESSEEYIRRFDDQDSYVWNMNYIANDNMGRLGAAKKALDRAIELDPDEPSWRYNYSILLQKTSDQSALDYLEALDDELKVGHDVRLKIVLLKSKVGESCKEEAQEIVEEYKEAPHLFKDFEKRVLLPVIFRIVDEPYAYVNPKTKRRENDEGNYLDTLNLPF